MGILTRMTRIWKADIHGVMDQFEDRRLVLNQALREMESALERKESELRSLRRNRDAWGSNLQKTSAEVAKLESDLNTALNEERDDIARFIIRKLSPLTRFESELARRVQDAEAQISKLEQTLAEQKLEWEGLKLKARDFRVKNEPNPAPDDLSRILSDAFPQSPAVEEIELELLRRKQMRKGGNTL